MKDTSMQTVLHSDPLMLPRPCAHGSYRETMLLNDHARLLGTRQLHGQPSATFPFFCGSVKPLNHFATVWLQWLGSQQRRNWPRDIHPQGNIALTVATGNEATGRIGDSPSTTSSKGPSTVEALEVNRSLQAWLPGMEPPEAESDEDDENKPTTWLLLVHHAKDEIRVELSLPLDVDHEGKVTVWRERIILRSMPLDGASREITPPALPDIDVAVRRKA